MTYPKLCCGKHEPWIGFVSFDHLTRHLIQEHGYKKVNGICK